MKKLFTIIALTISFSMNAQLIPVTENGTTGQRLSTSNEANHGDIGSNAVDLSNSDSASTTRGATGAASTAMGLATTASGVASTAMGAGTEASKAGSTAMGQFTTASGTASTAMGQFTKASGTVSTAMGLFTEASDFGSLVIGRYNSSGSSVTNSATAFSTANTAFVIGNGTGTGEDASDAFKVMFNGDTYVSSSLYLGGTEITSTAAELNLLSGATSLGTGILSPVTENSNTGVRLSTAVADNHGDIGSNAVDLSYSTGASTTRGATGYASTAMGTNTTASGAFSTAMGELTEASGEVSTAMGYLTTASGSISTAMGYETTASGEVSTAMGQSTEASGDYSTAMGRDTEASGDYSTAMGISTKASGSISTAMGGGTTASGNSSTAMGQSTTASDFGSTVIGQYNSSGSTVTNSATAFNAANTAFVIGNGVDGSNTSDAFKVMFNGDATLSNDLTVEGDIVISSDARLKANIVSLGSTLARLLLIDGKSYTMKKDGKQKIGVLAQDIQKVFPELVSTDDRDMLAVNYQGLVPVLINALKEQDGKMKEQDAKMIEQEKRLERLEAIISNMDK